MQAQGGALRSMDDFVNIREKPLKRFKQGNSTFSFMVLKESRGLLGEWVGLGQEDRLEIK